MRIRVQRYRNIGIGDPPTGVRSRMRARLAFGCCARTDTTFHPIQVRPTQPHSQTSTGSHFRLRKTVHCLNRTRAKTLRTASTAEGAADVTTIPDQGRRDFLIKGTTTMAIGAVAATAVPFLSYWQPFRHGGSRPEGVAGADEPDRTAVSLRRRQHAGGRRRCDRRNERVALARRESLNVSCVSAVGWRELECLVCDARVRNDAVSRAGPSADSTSMHLQAAQPGVSHVDS